MKGCSRLTVAAFLILIEVKSDALTPLQLESLE